MSKLHHHITHKILVIGSTGCGKTSLIESILRRSKCQYDCHTSTPGNSIKQCSYAQSVPFHELEIELKVFERTIDGALDRTTIQPYYYHLDTIIGMYDSSDYYSFEKMQLALDSILTLLNEHGRSSRTDHYRPTIYVLGNIRDHRQCKSQGPYIEVKEYVDRIGAIPLFNYCYSSRHIKAFHYVMMLNVYKNLFGHHLLNGQFQKAIENCRRHIYKSENCSLTETNSYTRNILSFFKKLKIPHHQEYKLNRHYPKQQTLAA